MLRLGGVQGKHVAVPIAAKKRAARQRVRGADEASVYRIAEMRCHLGVRFAQGAARRLTDKSLSPAENVTSFWQPIRIA